MPPLIRTFEKNQHGRDIAVGDIHGAFSRLLKALSEIKFNPAVDRLFITGDLLDKGNECIHLEDFLNGLCVYSVRGNHDQFAIEFVTDPAFDTASYMKAGGAWNVLATPQSQAKTAALIESLPLAIQVETCHGLVGIVHADCPFDSWDEFSQVLLNADGDTSKLDKAVMWYALESRDRIKAADIAWRLSISDVSAVIVGHSGVESRTVLGNVHYIETKGWIDDSSKKFTFIDLNTLKQIKY